MNFDLSALRGKAAAVLRGFSPAQLVVIALLAVAVVSGAVWFTGRLTTPTYGVLFSNLSSKDAAAVVAQLDAAKTPYQLTAGGSTIEVPTDQVDATRLAVSAAGLPKGSTVGYELLDSQGITTSSFMEQVDYQRALEGELDRTLSAMSGVSAAQVHLVMPADRLYSDAQRPASASVLLTTDHALTDDQVAAIVHLVASSVPDLDPAQVTVTDASGRLLTDTGTAGANAGASKAQNAVEAQLTADADSMLTQVLGAGHAVVRVNATLDFDQRTIQSETFDPKRTAVAHNGVETERYTTTTPNPAGALTTNPTPTPNPAATTNYNKNTGDTTYDVSRTVTSDTTAPGAVKRLSVAVMVDSRLSGAATPAAVRAAVAAAVGLDPTRGDTISVTAAPFDNSAARDAAAATKAAADAKAAAARTTLLQTIGGGVLLALAALALVLTALRRRGKELTAEELTALDVPAPGTSPDLLADTRPAPRSLSVDAPETNEADALLTRVASHPDQAANVLRGWIASDEVSAR